MITVYVSIGDKIKKHVINKDNIILIKDALWIDLLNPTREDEQMTETILKLEIPTLEEMQEIEITSRLYKEKNNLYMTATMMAKSDFEPEYDAVTFIVTKRRLITIRYIEPQAFKQFEIHIANLEPSEHHPLALLIGLLESSIDRIADILERIGHNLDHQTQSIFHLQPIDNEPIKLDFQTTLRIIGQNGDLAAKTRESLVSFNRIVTFLDQSEVEKLENTVVIRLHNLTKDIRSLSDHVSFLLNKVTFLLDATLGMINIEQNNIIKIFTVSAVIFLPPTLIASIYGMNFQNMPELHWKWSYPLAIMLMLLSSWLPFKYFKYRKWL